MKTNKIDKWIASFKPSNKTESIIYAENRMYKIGDIFLFFHGITYDSTVNKLKIYCIYEDKIVEEFLEYLSKKLQKIILKSTNLEEEIPKVIMSYPNIEKSPISFQ